MIYDYLYYKAYKQGLKIHYGNPETLACKVVSACFMMNYFTTLLLASILTNYNTFQQGYVLLHGAALTLFTFLICRNKHHERVINKYDKMPTDSFLIKANPIVVIFLSLSISMLIFAVTTMYKGKFWLFDSY